MRRDGAAKANAHLNAYYGYTESLRKAKTPIDRIGFQCHFGTRINPPERVLSGLERFSAFDLPISIAEFDMETADEDLQHRFMRDFTTATFSHPSVDAIVMWVSGKASFEVAKATPQPWNVQALIVTAEDIRNGYPIRISFWARSAPGSTRGCGRRPTSSGTEGPFTRGCARVEPTAAALRSPTPQTEHSMFKALSQRHKAAFGKVQFVTIVELRLHNPIAAAIGPEEQSEAAPFRRPENGCLKRASR
jgi:hypothetical protein